MDVMPLPLLPRFFFALLCAMVQAVPAWGHSWYPQECCSDRDCRPVDAATIGESGADYTFDGLRIPKIATRPSPDERYHVCVTAPDSGQRMIRCLFRPAPGS